MRIDEMTERQKRMQWPCPKCAGHGVYAIKHPSPSLGVRLDIPKTCERCGGSGIMLPPSEIFARTNP